MGIKLAYKYIQLFTMRKTLICVVFDISVSIFSKGAFEKKVVLK